MDENNPPMILPNGQVYCWAALTEMNRLKGKIVCPVTNETFPMSAVRKAFVM
jgi:macrophage erythroblast attacher